jgi:hypothetical protein
MVHTWWLHETAGVGPNRAPGKVYLHVFKTNGDKFFIRIPYKVKTAVSEGRALRVQSLEDNYIMIDLKGVTPDPVDTIIELDVIK